VRRTIIDEIDDWPVFAYGHVAIASWTDSNGERRVYLIARSDGLFSFDGAYLSKDPEEMRWIPDNVRAGKYDTEETAVKEIHAAYPWSRNALRETRFTK
jgi:hypothetical protein